MNDTSRIDIVTVDLSKPLRRENCGTLLATGDENANRFGAKIVRNGEAVDLTGYAVSGSFVRPDGATVTLDGTAEGNMACVGLSSSCYMCDGAFTLAVKIIKEGYTHTVRMVDGYIRRTDTGHQVATDETIISLDQMKGLAATMAETNKAAKTLMNELDATNEEAKSLVNELEDAANDAEQAVEKANSVVDKLPYVGANGNWCVWDDDAGEFVDSGFPSCGKDGTGVTILGSYDSEDALNAAHPTGNAGESYLIDGYLYVWSASETKWKNVGKIQGPAGANGTDGKTPVRGKDYWTASDQQSIVNDVLASLPVYNGEVQTV